MNFQLNFIHRIINKDLILGIHTNVHTRFPPEPNGYLHIGHAKSIFINFSIAQYYQGKCNLRFDDTNPEKEQQIYIESIKNDIQWLGFLWNNNIFYSSDYFEKFYEYAIILIKKGLAYVDELSIDDIRKYRGTLKSPGKNSPYRSRNIKDNLIYFAKMRDGMFSEGSVSLRAKIDMTSPCIIMRDPVLYRIKYTPHHRLGKSWCIYPTYDFSHCISDAIEGITHSLCTLEFQDNRILYNWILRNIGINTPPKQYEFSRLNIEYMLTSKRKLNILIQKKIVDGWDDPRMPTISGLRRRGYTAKSIRMFCQNIGVSKQNSQIELSTLETCIRNHLDKCAPRLMAVIHPIKIIINNMPIGHKEIIIIPNHPKNPQMGTRKIIFSKEIFIDRFDFNETFENSKYPKLTLGKKIRLRYAYIIKAEYIKKDINGNIICIYCTYDPNTLKTHLKKNNKTYSIIHWVSAEYNIPSEFRLYGKLFTNPNPMLVKNITKIINPNSLIISKGFVEKNIKYFDKFQSYQFEREGYFVIDNSCHHLINKTLSYLIFNRTVELKITKKKI